MKKIDANSFKIFGQLAWNDSRKRKKVVQVFGQKAFPRLVLLEEKFFGAYLCYKRLKNRNARFGKLKYTHKLLAHSTLRTIHNDEYFFFTCCNFIYSEIILMQSEGLLLKIPKSLLTKLKELKEERRYHEHGKDWYWGKLLKNNPPSTTKGDNFDFERNVKVLKQVYDSIVAELNV